jgi:Dipeptidyl aminopeptidases/acylaminoacyl-peptidases
MIKPDNFDKNKRYPVLVYLYGGPGSQTVRNNWEGGQLWYQYMAQEGILVVSVDNRGTGFRGEEFKKSHTNSLESMRQKIKLQRQSG